MVGRKPKEGNRAHGEGSIYQRKDGTWAGVSRYTDPETGATKKHFVYGKTRKEAAEKKSAWEEELKKGLIPTRRKMTVAEWLDTWLETYAKVRVRQNTFEDYSRIVNKHLIPSVGNHTLKELRPEHVQRMINQKLKEGNLSDGKPLSQRSVQYIYTILYSALDQAVKNQMIIRNVCNVVQKPSRSKAEITPWTQEQIKAFLISVKDHRLYPVYITEWGTGLRRSELLALQWEDITLNNGSLAVRRSMVRVKGGYALGEPKTNQSRRTIPLPELVIAELKKWKKQQAKEKLAVDIEYNPLNMVFCDEAGQPLKPDYLSRSFKKHLQAAGLPDIRFHDLRHGHATTLLELGENIKVVSDRLGHSSIAVTGDIYSHVQEEIQKRASNKLDESLQLK